MKIERGVSLADHSTFRIGGKANYFTSVSTIEEVKEAISFAKQKGLPFFVLGKGSNTLFDDKGYSGLVILNQLSFFEQNKDDFYVGSGFSLALLGLKTAKLGYTGLEFAAGIPATLGGAIYMNAGANGAQISDALIEVEYLDSSGNIIKLSKDEIDFEYRFSSFQKSSGCILSALFKLKKGDDPRKAQLKLLSARNASQPASEQCAGCVFRNPYIGPAGKLIEDSGLKGITIGEAQISPIHANFIVNKGKAKAKDVLALIDLAQKRVYRHYGVEMQTEIRYIPYEPAKL